MKPTFITTQSGEIEVKRNKKSKSIKLRINHDGNPEVTAPYSAPLFVIKRFIDSKQDWISQHSHKKQYILSGQLIGRGHEVIAEKSDHLSTRVTKNEIIVKLPLNTLIKDDLVQQKLTKAAVRALRQESQDLLPILVDAYAKRGVGTYKQVKIKLIKSRWGSFSSDGTLSLSLFLMQLPDELIDYVIVHELCHSVHMNHSQQFWNRVGEYLPNYKQLRKQLKNHHMRITPS